MSNMQFSYAGYPEMDPYASPDPVTSGQVSIIGHVGTNGLRTGAYTGPYPKTGLEIPSMPSMTVDGLKLWLNTDNNKWWALGALAVLGGVGYYAFKK